MSGLKPDKKSIHITKCPDCGRRTIMLQFYNSWYGWESTCIKCGRKWINSEWMPLPWEPGIRKRRIKEAKKKWRSVKK